jgi:hypothetical protein
MSGAVNQPASVVARKVASAAKALRPKKKAPETAMKSEAAMKWIL